MLTVSIGTVVFWPGGAGRGATAKPDLAQNALDPASILEGRSPGDREPGALFQTKPLRNLMDAAGLPTAPRTNLVEPSPLPAIDEVPRAFAAIVPPGEMPVVPAATPPVVPLGSIDNASPPYGVTPFLPVLLPPVGVPVAFGPATDTFPPQADTPVGGVAAVPEPASWLTMVLGFLAIGRTIRTARAAGRSPA